MPLFNDLKQGFSKPSPRDVPNLRNVLMVCGRLPILATGTYSTAPAEARVTADVSPTARRCGMITPCVPVESAVRSMATRLGKS